MKHIAPLDQFECVPNISSGRDFTLIKSLSDAISQGGATLLHTHSNFDADRTVFTYTGSYKEIFQSTLSLAQKAIKLIDFQKYQGIHPAIGILDVVPIVPLNGSMEDAIKLSRQIGITFSKDLSIPVYMYEEASFIPQHQALPRIRKDSAFSTPDYQTSLSKLSTGKSVIGARKPLIAYNVNLSSLTPIDTAKKIATRIRKELPKVRAIGWYMEKYGMSQVSCNILDDTVTSIARVYKKTKAIARELGSDVNGSELIGLIPQRALFKARRELGINKNSAVIKALGLDIIEDFDISKRTLPL